MMQPMLGEDRKEEDDSENLIFRLNLLYLTSITTYLV